MKTRTVFHVLDGDSRACARLARSAFELGHHAEVYASVEEISRHAPQRGIVLVRDSLDHAATEDWPELLGDRGIWLPIVAMAENPSLQRVIRSIKSGVLDYLSLPIHTDGLADLLARIEPELVAYTGGRRRMLDARDRINLLSPREREVLDWLAEGSSNKTIAEGLKISPRTVEIHRANMMSKLGANHPADAIKLRLVADLESTAQPVGGRNRDRQDSSAQALLRGKASRSTTPRS